MTNNVVTRLVEAGSDDEYSYIRQGFRYSSVMRHDGRTYHVLKRRRYNSDTPRPVESEWLNKEKKKVWKQRSKDHFDKDLFEV